MAGFAVTTEDPQCNLGLFGLNSMAGYGNLIVCWNKISRPMIWLRNA